MGLAIYDFPYGDNNIRKGMVKLLGVLNRYPESPSLSSPDFSAVIFDFHCFFNIRLIKASDAYLLRHSSLFITRHSFLLNLYCCNPMSATSILICPSLMGCSNWTAMEYCCSFEGLLMTWCHVYHSFSKVNGKLHGAGGFAQGSSPLPILMNYNINITQPCMFLQGNAIASFNPDFLGQRQICFR